jgi:hypothetical protein
MGHGDLLVTQLYLNGQATTAPYIPRVASAAGRLRSNAVIVEVESSGKADRGLVRFRVRELAACLKGKFTFGGFHFEGNTLN